ASLFAILPFAITHLKTYHVIGLIFGGLALVCLFLHNHLAKWNSRADTNVINIMSASLAILSAIVFTFVGNYATDSTVIVATACVALVVAKSGVAAATIRVFQKNNVINWVLKCATLLVNGVSCAVGLTFIIQ